MYGCMPRKGRLPKNITVEAQKKILASVKAGTPRKYAAMAAGVAPRTLERWLSNGRKEQKGDAWRFWLSLQKSESGALEIRVKRLNKAATKGNWKIDVWFLERRFETDFGVNRSEVKALQKQLQELATELEQMRANIRSPANDPAAPAANGPGQSDAQAGATTGGIRSGVDAGQSPALSQG